MSYLFLSSIVPLGELYEKVRIANFLIIVAKIENNYLYLESFFIALTFENWFKSKRIKHTVS